VKASPTGTARSGPASAIAAAAEVGSAVSPLSDGLPQAIRAIVSRARIGQPPAVVNVEVNVPAIGLSEASSTPPSTTSIV
jgi:hypothetical protein